MSGVAVENFKVTCGSAFVAHIRELRRLFSGMRQLFLLSAELLALPISDQRIRDISKSLLHGALVKQSGFLCLGLCELYPVSYSPAFKNRLEGAATHGPESGRPREKPRKRRTLIASRSR